jgi:uncharacterized phage protein (TIGR02218 family)
MTPISPAYQTALEASVARRARCWRITLRTGEVRRFTSHTKPIRFGGEWYEAGLAGYSVTDVDGGIDLSPDNLEVQGFLSHPAITEAELEAGAWDYAEMSIFEVLWDNLSAGSRPIRGGIIGQVQLLRNTFVAEFLSVKQYLSKQILEIGTPTCRARFGDARCKIALGPYTVSSTVTGAISDVAWTDSARSEATGTFTLGEVHWTSGNNTGQMSEVRLFTTGGTITIEFPPPFAIEAGDGYDMIWGCDKLPATCHGTYANMLNFRGENLRPGNDAILGTGNV